MLIIYEPGKNPVSPYPPADVVFHRRPRGKRRNRDPVHNRWLFDFGLMACALVIPYALVFGGWRGIPIWWRLIDCSFGVFGFIPLWFCRQWTGELESRVTC